MGGCFSGSASADQSKGFDDINAPPPAAAPAPPKVEPIKEDAATAAALRGDVTALRTALDAGTSVHHKNPAGSPLLCVAAAAAHADVLDLLLARGADPQAVGASGLTALHYAVMGKGLDCVKMLLAQGAKLDVKDDGGRTALDWAETGQESSLVNEGILLALRDAGMGKTHGGKKKGG